MGLFLPSVLLPDSLMVTWALLMLPITAPSGKASRTSNISSASSRWSWMISVCQLLFETPFLGGKNYGWIYIAKKAHQPSAHQPLQNQNEMILPRHCLQEREDKMKNWKRKRILWMKEVLEIDRNMDLFWKCTIKSKKAKHELSRGHNILIFKCG